MSERGKQALCWSLVLLLGLGLRLWLLSDQLIADDEWHALHMVLSSGYAEIFTHFGHADHSIPLTLFYETLANSIGLNEWLMRAPLLLAGLASLIALPWAWRRWLRGMEPWLFAGLLAVSPLLVYFSRTARPYALLVLLVGLALPLAWRWWQERRWGLALPYLVCVVLAGWLNPVSLALSTAPFLWFGGAGVYAIYRQQDWQPLLQSVGLGLILLLPLAALLGPPLANSFADLSGKTGVHQVSPAVLWQSWQLFTGSAWTIVNVVMAALCLLGARQLWRRDPRFLGYLLLCALAATVAVALTDAAWISHALVLTRYLLPLSVIILLFAALGLASCLAPLRKVAHGLPAAVAGLSLIGFIWLGPLPQQYAYANQFTGHMRWQFDYDSERNPYSQLDEIAASPAYEQIRANHPDGEALIISAPWYFEWHRNAMYRYQQLHGQQIAAGFIEGRCANGRAGEYRPNAPGMAFAHFRSLASLLAEPRDADYLIFHHQPDAGTDPRIPAQLDQCIQASRQAFGPAWFEDESVVVFRLAGAQPHGQQTQ